MFRNTGSRCCWTQSLLTPPRNGACPPLLAVILSFALQLSSVLYPCARGFRVCVSLRVEVRAKVGVRSAQVGAMITSGTRDHFVDK